MIKAATFIGTKARGKDDRGNNHGIEKKRYMKTERGMHIETQEEAQTEREKAKWSD